MSPIFESPNMDDMSAEDAETCYEIFGLLQNYAFYILNAKRSRLAGNIQRALEDETRAQIIYEKLPEEYRW